MFKHSLIALAALGTGIIGFSATGASALTLQQQPAAQTGATSNMVVDVNHRANHARHWTHWDRRYHGNRCRNWSRGCRHYHNGWYYANPWWTLPFVGAGIAIGVAGGGYDGYDGYSNKHVRWCSNHYRSYNPRNNTWVSYSGNVRQCVSPYGP